MPEMKAAVKSQMFVKNCKCTVEYITVTNN